MNKRVLYEQIMSDVAKVVKKHLNENDNYKIEWNNYNDSTEYKTVKDSFYKMIDSKYLDRNIQYLPAIKKNGSLFFIDLYMDSDQFGIENKEFTYVRITGKNLLELCLKIDTLIYSTFDTDTIFYTVNMDKKFEKIYKQVTNIIDGYFIDDDYINVIKNKITKILDTTDNLNNKKYEFLKILDSIDFNKAILKNPRYL